MESQRHLEASPDQPVPQGLSIEEPLPSYTAPRNPLERRVLPSSPVNNQMGDREQNFEQYVDKKPNIMTKAPLSYLPGQNLDTGRIPR